MRLGADEAGKGPVLGPMVAAAVRADPAALPDGIDDSKRLTPARREEVAAAIREAADVAVGVATVAVDRIDDPATDMNGLTVAAHAAALADVARPGDRAVVDAGDVSAARFGRRVRERVAREPPGDGGRGGTGADTDAADDAAGGVDIDVDARHGADADDPLVGAASVVAKVERDARIDALEAEFGAIGSGYPSDPTTREFLASFVRERGRLPDCARASWATSEDVLAAAEQSALSEF